MLDCIRVLEHGQGLATEGLFRVSADAENLQHVRAQLESGMTATTRVSDTAPAQQAMQHDDVGGRHVIAARMATQLRV